MKIKMITKLIAVSLVIFSVAGCSNSKNLTSGSSNKGEVVENKNTALSFNKDNYTTQSLPLMVKKLLFVHMRMWYMWKIL